MPEADYIWLPRESLLTFEELARLARVFAGLGASKVRLTGGEPLLRQGLDQLVAQLRQIPGVSDIALTTNGMLLARHADALRAAGLDRITISLDTLHPDRFLTLARSAHHSDVLAGIEAAREAGFTGLKLNTVVMRGVNDDELVDLLEFGRERGIEVRFIEYMDVGGATGWEMTHVISRREMLHAIGSSCGAVEPITELGSRAPAERFRLSDGTTFGIIASTTAPFCRTCDRSRVTADGTWFLCLYAADGIDLRAALRGGASHAELAALVTGVWQARTDRGAEERVATAVRQPLYPLEGLRADPRREMHTRGG